MASLITEPEFGGAPPCRRRPRSAGGRAGRAGRSAGRAAGREPPPASVHDMFAEPHTEPTAGLQAVISDERFVRVVVRSSGGGEVAKPPDEFWLR